MTSRLRDVYGVDGRLSLIIGVSVAAHLGIAIYAWMTDLETPATPASVAVTYQPERELPGIVIEAAAVPDTLPGAATPAAPSQTPRPVVPKTHAPGTTITMSTAEAQRMAAILTGDSSGEKRAPGAELAAQLQRTQTTEIGNTTSGGFRADPNLHIGTGGGPTIEDPTHAIASTHRDETSGRIQLKPVRTAAQDSTLTVDAVLAKIGGAYMSGLTRCYAKGLATDASLSGKIAMTFSVTERGGLDEVTASGVSKDVDGCVQTLMSSWHFAIPRDVSGAATDASFAITLQLTPN